MGFFYLSFLVFIFYFCTAMKIKYIDIIDQTFYFPQEEFRLDEENDTLLYYDIPLMDIIEEHGTPLKLTYLPKISSQIKKAKNYFERAFSTIRIKIFAT